MKKNGKNKVNGANENKRNVIASRKACKADGTGLSHYILVDQKAR